jgi:hypothetical protein
MLSYAHSVPLEPSARTDFPSWLAPIPAKVIVANAARRMETAEVRGHAHVQHRDGIDGAGAGWRSSIDGRRCGTDSRS